MSRLLVIRLVRSHTAIRGTAPLVLAEASIDTGAGAGVLATIYMDRMERMAELADTDAALLLGRAVAHELGHLLLATTTHSARGLVRAQWTPRDIQRNQVADWKLAKEDAAAIRRRLQSGVITSDPQPALLQHARR